MPQLNTTAMAGVDEHNETLSWPSSESSGRFCGSRYATAVAEALVRMNFPEWHLDNDELDNLEYGDATSATYAQLVKTIRHTLFEEVDSRAGNTISFSARDDQWAMEWKARTGINTLPDYETRWKALRPVVTNTTESDMSQAGSIRLSNDRPPYRYQQAVQVVKRKALLYLDSNPGLAEAAKNHSLHSSIRKLLKGTQFSPEELGRISSALDYRQWYIMAEANVLRDELGLHSYPDCEDVDPSSANFAPGIFQCVAKYHLYTRPTEDEGFSYAKGIAYVAEAISQAGWSLAKAEIELSRLKRVVG